MQDDDMSKNIKMFVKSLSLMAVCVGCIISFYLSILGIKWVALFLGATSEVAVAVAFIFGVVMFLIFILWIAITTPIGIGYYD